MTGHAVPMPDIGEGVAEAEVADWLVAVGDEVTTDTPLAEILTDKASVEVYAPVAGVISSLEAAVGEVIAVGAPLVIIAPSGEAQTPPSAPARADKAEEPAPAPVDAVKPAATSQRASSRRGRALASPAVRVEARERGIDIRLVAGSGPAGRVLRQDLDIAEHNVRSVTGQQSAATPQSSTSQSSTPHSSTPHSSTLPWETTTEPLRGMRRKISDRMTETWRTVPHITIVDDVDVTELERLRKRLNQDAPAGGRLTILAFIARAVVRACAEHPQVNATFDGEQAEITNHGVVNLGIAVQTDNGLVVPVIRDAHTLDVAQLGGQLTEMAEAARDRTISRDQLNGSTITISSLGRTGGLVTTPILNAPEVAIVGVNRLEVRPRWNGHSFEPRSVMNLSSSFDHRILDGSDAAEFVKTVKDGLEHPSLLFWSPPNDR